MMKCIDKDKIDLEAGPSACPDFTQGKQRGLPLQKELPEGWGWKTLGEVCDILSGYGFPKELQGKTTGDLPFYKVGDISQTWHSGNKYLATANNYISLDEAKEIKAKPFLPGTTVMAKIGEAIKLNRRALLSKPSLVDNNVMGIYPKPEYLDQKYNFYFLLTVKLGDYSQATTVPSVRKSDVSEIAFPLAPLDQQKLIVSEIEKQFSRLDEAAAALKRVRAGLKRYKASVLKAAVEGRLTEEWRKLNPKVEPAGKLLKRILAERKKKWEEAYPKKKYKEPSAPDTSILPELPKGWVWATVGQLAVKVQYGSSAKTNENPSGVPVLRMGNIFEGRLKREGLKYLPKSHSEFPALFLEKEDLLFNRTNSPELVGKTAVYMGNPNPCSFASYLIRVQFYNGASSHFVSSFINSAYGRNWIKTVVSQQVGQANVNGTKLQALSIPLPPAKEQKVIVEEIESRLSVAEEIEETIDINLKRAERLRQAILKKAFSGRLV